MKRLIILMVFSVLIQSIGYSQSCLPEGITFLTQVEIDDFQTNYPNCIEIEGDVKIGDWIETDITNLSGLSDIAAIGGTLSIYATALKDLTGLDNLTSIGGELVIGGYDGGGNYDLTSLSGLDNLTSIGGNITISDNDALTSLTGLEGLTSMKGLTIFDNFALTDLTGLENLTSIDGHLSISFSWLLTKGENQNNNQYLTSLTGLEGLTSVGGSLWLRNINVTNLTGLDNLTFIGGNLWIYRTHTLTSLTGLENLTSAGALSIERNEVLTTLTGLDNLTSIGGRLSIIDNNDLINLTGLDNVTSIGGDLAINENPSLSGCETLWLCDYLSNPNGVVDIYNNAPGCNNPPEIAITCGITLSCLPHGNYYFRKQYDIDNFSTDYPNCTEIAGDIEIYGYDIINLEGLNLITFIGGSLTIGQYYYSNPNLTSLTGLENIDSIGEGLFINDNDALISLSGLNNVTSVGGKLWISYNDGLTSLTGLENLTSIGGDLSIRYSDALSSLSGLENIDAASISNLSIYDNPFLFTCDVQSICDYLLSPNGTVLIHDNAPGCNSQEDVKEKCWVSINEYSLSDNLKNHPNPFSTSTNIEYELSQPETVKLTIYSRIGGQVDVIEQHQQQGINKIVWTPKNLPNGIYYFRLQAGEQVRQGKMVLMR